MVKRFIKRTFDIIVSSCAILVLSPVLLIVSIMVRVKLGSPVIFMQERPGLHAKIFTMYKFRSMTDECDDTGQLMPDHVRLTNFGKFLRKTSLDELPELFNIFKGDMSFVGPRPLLVRYLERYNDEQARRHDVRPGLTGWAQINGRNAITWEEKFRLDVWYVDHWNLWLDLKIFIMTFVKVIRKEGISAEGEATMGEFLGTKEITKEGE
ncbi:sugar transferase [Aminipila terrae]|uniref:Sugar transferase n=1 Tax=Aminipila terrae TaxID=2697030 RepID=A0A6P1MDI6_9FIRM|nr:sugar transferase [Aminipila terrae]QHI72082.1 sugar transferase [Aminipila terrae]